MAQTFSLTAQLRLQGPTNLSQVTGQIRNQLGSINASVGLNTAAATAGLNKVSSGAKASAQALRQMQAQAAATAATLNATVTVTNQGASAFRQFSEQAGLAARRFVAFTVAAGTMVNVVRGIKEGIRAAVDFELSMNKAAQVSSLTTDQLNSLSGTISTLAKNFGVSSAALAETQGTLLQAGLTAKQTTDALRALALTDLAPTFDSMKQSTEGLIAAFRQFSLSSGQFESTLSSMNAVAAQFAVESSDIITAVQKAGGAFRLSAGDMKSGTEALNEFMGLFTAVRATTRESADSIATGLRTIFTRFQRADTVKALQDLGINLRYTRNVARAMGDLGLEDQFVGAYEAVRRLSQGLEGLRETDPRYAQAIEQLGGYRQISRVIPLLKEFKTAEEAKNVAIAGGIKLQLDAEKRQETMAAKIIKLKEEYLDLFRKISNDKGFQVVANSLLSMASGFAKVVDAARPLLPVLLGLAAVKLTQNASSIATGFGRAFLAPPGAALGKTGSGVLRFAQGSRTPIGAGYVSGSGNNDTEHALLMPGEFVLNKQAVTQLGAPNLRDANEGKARFALKKYATGSTDPVGRDKLLARQADLQRNIEGERSFQAATRETISAVTGTSLETALPQLNEELSASERALATFEGALKGVTDSLAKLEAATRENTPRPSESQGPSRLDRLRANQQAAGQTSVRAAVEARRPAGPALTEAQQEVAARAAIDAASPGGPRTSASAAEGMTAEQRALFFTFLGDAERGARRYTGNGADQAAVDDAALEAWAKKVKSGKVTPEAAAAAGKEFNPKSMAFGAGKNAGKRFWSTPGATTAVDVAEVATTRESSAPSAAYAAGNDALQQVLAQAGLQGLPAEKDFAGWMKMARVLGLPTKGVDSIYSLKTPQLKARVEEGLRTALTAQAQAAEPVPTPVTVAPPGVERPLAAQGAKSAGAVPPRRPRRPKAPGGAGDDNGPPTPPADPFEDYRRKYPDEAAYQDAVLAQNDEERARRELAKGDRFAREMARTRQAQDEQKRAARRGSLTITDPLYPPVTNRYAPEDVERENYQLAQLAAAKARYGDQYGVPGDELAENRRQGRAEAIRDIHNDQYVRNRRAENAAFVDPLVEARDTRRDRYEAGERERGAGLIVQQRASGEAAARQQEQEERVLRSLGAQRLSETRQEAVTSSLARQRLREPYTSTTAATFEENKDGSKTLTGGLLAERAARLVEERLNARGGAENLSDQTIQAVRNQAATEEEESIRRELVSAQERLLELLKPQMSAVERYTKAVEDAEKAMAGVAEVAKDQSGKVLGLTETVDAARQQGIAAPGAGGAGFGIRARLSDAANRAREFYNNNRLTRLNRSLSAYTEGPGFTVAAGAIAGAGAYASNYFSGEAGTASDAYKTDAGRSKFTANTGAAGAVSGALFGGATGFALGGPIGAGVGAVVGGAYGLYSALQEAEKNIRQAKIDGALTELGEKLNAFATGLPNAGALAGIDSTLATIMTESQARTTDEAKPSFNPFSGNWWRGQDPVAFAQVSRKNFRQDFGPLLPNINQGLTRRAETLGRESPDAPLAGLMAQLSGSAGSLNERLIKIVADLRGVPVEDIRKEYEKTLVQAQQAGRVERENKAARQAQDQQVNSYARLAQAIESASDSLAGLQRRAEALTNVLDGTVGGSRVSAGTEALENGFGRFDPSAVRPFGIINSLNPQLGGGLLSSATAANTVGRELPSVLASVIRTQGLDESNITSRVSEGLFRQLGYARAQDAPQDIQRVVGTVIAGLNESQAHGRGVGGVLAEAQTDVSKYVEKLLAGAVDPLKEYGPRIGRQIQDNANRFVDGLTQLYQRVQQVGQLFDQLAQTRADNTRLATTFAYENAGRRGQVLDGLSLDQLEGGFNARQQRLAGVNGATAFDPRAIGVQLAQARTQVQQATQRQQEVFERTGGRGPEFQAAADEVVRLTTRASNLQQALKHLADVSQRHAAIQEKLNKLKEEEEGRLGLAERFASADPAEQMRMSRGFLLANQAAQQGNLDGFSSEDRRTIIDTLRGAGGVTLSGFQGAPRADDLLRNLLGNSFGGAFRLTQGQQAERRGLQQEAVGRGATAEAAVHQLIEHQQQGSQDFFRNLSEQQNQFFSRLERTLLQIRVQDVQNDRARASARVNEIQGREQSRSLLNGVGVTTTAQLEVLRGKTPQVEELRQAIAAQNAERGRVTAAVRGVGSFTAFGGGGQDLGQFLAGANLSDEQTGRVSARFRELMGSAEARLQQTQIDQGFQQRARRTGQPIWQQEYNDARNGVARRFLTQALREEGARDNGGKVREALTPFQGIQGLNTGALVQTLNGPNADAFVRALNQFDSSGNRLEDFGRHLSDATQRVADLDAQLRNLNGQLNPTTPRPDAAGTVTRAGGGDIFRPMGTDTVPAMLTPGEFVVNAKSAAANAALLHNINTARGPVQYRQTGGAIRTAQANAPTTAQVANGYLWAVDKIRTGMSWLGFSNGGRVPQYLAEGGAVSPQEYERQRREAAATEAGRASSTATISELPEDLVRELNKDARRRAQAAARQEARAERQRQRGLDAAGNAAFAAQAANFNRAAFLTNGPRRPGDEGQRAIAARSLEAQNKQYEKAYQQNGQLREFLASRVSSQSVRTRPFAFGGMVPGTGSTDTVPALLTRGEAVLNTRAVNHLGANAIQRFNQGGLVGNVQYRAEGGSIQGGGGNTDQLAAALSLFSQATGGFVSSAQTLAQTFNVFAGQAQALSQAMSSFPRVLSGQFSHQVTVVHNGAEVFAKLTPFVEQLVTDRVNTVLTRTFKEHMPEAGIVLS